MFVGDVDFPAVFAGVTGTRDARGRAGTVCPTSAKFGNPFVRFCTTAKT